MKVWGVLFFCILLPAIAMAEAKVNVSIIAEKEIEIVDKGVTKKKWVEATDIFQGEIIRYTVVYANIGDTTAENVVIDDPIPEGMSLIFDSVSPKEGAQYSIDNGKTYKRPALLTYKRLKADGSKVTEVAAPEQYTNIRWIVKIIDAKAKGDVSFKATVN